MERKLRVDYGEFTNCLRIAIVPDDLQDERIEEVCAYCLQYGFSNVMLFFNAEEYNLGHITKEELLPWIETIKKAKRVLESNGISVSLNPWIEIGHLDRGRKLKEGQNFTTMVDMDGKQLDMVACFWDDEWRKYYFELLEWYLKEVNPDFLWIEDDFRLHNHAPLKYGGCFCKLHMQKFNEKLGKEYSRAEFVEKIFAKGKANAERKAFLDVNRETILNISEEIGKRVEALGLKTRIGLMSSMPQRHCMEARDWKEITKNLSAGEEYVNRIHLPCYEEMCGKKYFRAFNAVSMIVRTFLPEDTYIYPELENGSFSNFTKDSRFLRFQLESSIPLLPVGMTYDIYDFVGNGTIKSFGYGEEIKKITPYLQGVVDLGIQFKNLHGVMLPVDEKAAYNVTIEKGWQDLINYPEMDLHGYLGGLGMNCKPTVLKEMKDEVVFLVGGSLKNFTNEQLEKLFSDNFVIVDGGAVLGLQGRGLAALVGVKDAQRIPSGLDEQAYEEAVDGWIVEGIKRYRASCQEKAGDYIKIEYGLPVKVYTNVYNSKREYYGIGAVATEHFAVFPFVVGDAEAVTGGIAEIPFYEQYHPLRKAFYYEILKKQQNCYVQTNVCGLHVYTYKRGKDEALIFVNSTVNSYEKLTFDTNIPFSKVYVVNREGKLVQKEYKRVGNKVEVDMYLEYLSTATLILGF